MNIERAHCQHLNKWNMMQSRFFFEIIHQIQLSIYDTKAMSLLHFVIQTDLFLLQYMVSIFLIYASSRDCYSSVSTNCCFTPFNSYSPQFCCGALGISGSVLPVSSIISSINVLLFGPNKALYP